MLDIMPTKKDHNLKLLYAQSLRVKIDDYYHRKLNSKENSDENSPLKRINPEIDRKYKDDKNNFGKFKHFTKSIISTFVSFASASPSKNDNKNFYNSNNNNSNFYNDNENNNFDNTKNVSNNKKYNTRNNKKNENNNNENNMNNNNKNNMNNNNEEIKFEKLEKLEKVEESQSTALKRPQKYSLINHKSLFDKALKITKVDYVFNNADNQSLSICENHMTSNLSTNNLNSPPLNNTHDSTLSLSPVVQYIIFGRYRFETWYKSFYPQERISSDGGIHICDKCLIGLRPGSFHEQHYKKCPITRPPGKVVKRQGDRTIYEIDGESGADDYCRNLCLLAMFFISGKVAYHEVDHFVFYVLTVQNSTNTKFVGGGEEEEVVGYFSRDKDLELNHTMSCLFIFPPHMKQGHGSYLIDYSYKVAKSLGVIGSPEKPLSTTGLIAFRSYWCKVLNEYLRTRRFHSKISIKTISMELSIAEFDIITTLQYLGKIKKSDDNYFIIK